MFEKLRKDFPYLEVEHPLIYCDNGATTQKPRQVIQAIADFYAHSTAPVYRGVYKLAEKATELYENARVTVAQFIGAKPEEIIFTSGTTAGINGLVEGWGRRHLQAGDEIILTRMEHHAQFVPWIRLAQEKGLVVHIVPLSGEELDYEAYLSFLSPKTKFVGCVLTSNVLGITNDVRRIISAAHAVGAKVCVDAAQAAGHQSLDVRIMNPDFLVFSGHKMLGPTGIGVLYIRSSLQPFVEPYQVGGGMVFSVTDTCAQWLSGPQKFEAGTPPIAQVIGLAAAIRYLQEQVPFEQLAQHESSLSEQLRQELAQHERIRLISSAQAGHMVTFAIEGIHGHDVAAYFDRYNIAVRAGHHCTQPLHNYLGVESSVRVSFYLYNTHQEVEHIIDVLRSLLSLKNL